MPLPPHAVVFLHIDGTLLDPYTHPLEAARSALHRVDRDRVPLVLCSSRTRVELEFIQRQLGLRHPFICENGGAVIVPDDYFTVALPNAREAAGSHIVEFGRPYQQVVDALRRTADRLGLRVVGYHDMSVDEVARDAGLSLLQARLAKLREYDEPFRIDDPAADARPRLVKALSAARLACLPGGRREHVGSASDRGACVDWLRDRYREAFGSVRTIGLGDGLTDRVLLARVDQPLIIRRPLGGASGRPNADTDPLLAIRGDEVWADAVRTLVQSGRRGASVAGPLIDSRQNLPDSVVATRGK